MDGSSIIYLEVYPEMHTLGQFYKTWEVVVAQLIERLLLIPEVRVTTPVLGKIYIEHLFVYYQLY